MPTNEEPHARCEVRGARCEGTFHSSILLPSVLLCCCAAIVFTTPKSIATIEAPRRHDRDAHSDERRSIDRVRKMGTLLFTMAEETTADEKILV